MEKFFSQKLLLTLLVGLFLGGCELFEDIFEHNTPSTALKHLISDGRGKYDGSKVFFISKDATEYTEAFREIDLDYHNGSDTKAIYTGFVEVSGVEWHTTITLSSITDKGGHIHIDGHDEYNYSGEFVWY